MTFDAGQLLVEAPALIDISLRHVEESDRSLWIGVLSHREARFGLDELAALAPALDRIASLMQLTFDAGLADDGRCPGNLGEPLQERGGVRAHGPDRRRGRWRR